MNPSLKVLNGLASIMESVAIDYLGEAKSEISGLCAKLESDKAYAIEDRLGVAQELREVSALYRIDNKFQASRQLGELSRRLWTDLLSHKEQRDTYNVDSPDSDMPSSQKVIYYSDDEVAQMDGFESYDELQKFEEYLICEMDKEPSLADVDYDEMWNEIILGDNLGLSPENRGIARRIEEGWSKMRAALVTTHSELTNNSERRWSSQQARENLPEHLIDGTAFQELMENRHALGLSGKIPCLSHYFKQLNPSDAKKGLEPDTNQTAAEWILDQVKHLSPEDREKVRLAVTLPPFVPPK